MIRAWLAAFLILFALPAQILAVQAQSGSAPTIPQGALIQPAELASMLKGGPKPTILQVGFKVMYDEAHIPGAVYAGPGSKDEGIAALKEAAGSIDKGGEVILYCGCCPWERCPNVAAAWRTMKEMGFTNLKVLYIANNFGADWVEKGYPVVKG
ncbi:MAG TPA: rhodanese-like domain-containing protein [Rhizomicrobium sp.]|jgi:rhodanese-related sulfurtransferase